MKTYPPGVHARFRQLVRQSIFLSGIREAMVTERHNLQERLAETFRRIQLERQILAGHFPYSAPMPDYTQQLDRPGMPGIDDPLHPNWPGRVLVITTSHEEHKEKLLELERREREIQEEVRLLDERLHSIAPVSSSMKDLVRRLANTWEIDHEAVALHSGSTSFVQVRG